MNMHRKLLEMKKKNPLSAGYSFIEVLVSLIIIALIGGILYFSYAVSVKSINSSRHKLQYAIIRLNTDTVLRKNIQRINIPYWINETPDITANENKIYLDWIDGKKEKKTITFSNKVSFTECIPILTSNKKIKGIEVKYLIDNNEYKTVSLFSSRPYGEIEL